MASVAQVVRRLLLLSVGGVFLFAGISKALDPGAFALAITRYRLVPWWFAVALALYLPFLEIIAASALAFRSTRPPALFVLLLLTLIFTAALGWAELRHLDISCGCLGQSPTGLRFALLRNSLLLAGIGFLLRTPKS